MSESSRMLQLGPISPAATGPLYRQIVDAVKREVLANRLRAGDALPSYRALAEELLVSLITVKRAYEELEREGVTFSRQGLGTFIAAQGTDLTRADRRQAAQDALRGAVQAGREAGLSDRQLAEMLRAELRSATSIDATHSPANALRVNAS